MVCHQSQILNILVFSKERHMKLPNIMLSPPNISKYLGSLKRLVIIARHAMNHQFEKYSTNHIKLNLLQNMYSNQSRIKRCLLYNLQYEGIEIKQ